MRIGVFGGTFDPPHVGHLIVAQDAALALGLDLVLFVPAATPPHKLNAAVSPAADRTRMLELALAGDERFACDDVELKRPGPSYTVDTLRTLRQRDPSASWTLLIGADQYAEFGGWREPAEIRRLAEIAVLTRGGRHGGDPDTTAVGVDTDRERRLRLAGVTRLDDGAAAVAVTRIDVSATAVRRRVAAGLPIRYLVPRLVEEFIFEQRLYVRNGNSATG